MRKRKSSWIFALAALGLVALIAYAAGSRKVADSTGVLVSRLEGAFSKFGLNDDNLIREQLVERRRGLRRYMRLSREYRVPRSFAAGGFEREFSDRVARSGFRVAKKEAVSDAAADSTVFTVKTGALDIFILKLTRPKAARLPAVARKFPNPKAAIVIDDFGYNMNNLETLLAIKRPVTFSVLPNLPYSARIAKLAAANGHEVILHLPLEPHKKDAREETDTINSRMTKEEIAGKLEKAIASVPGMDGVSNHMGSKSTEEEALMETIFGELRSRGLYFLDSLTSEKSVCGRIAARMGVRYAARDIFLDNSTDEDCIRRQVLSMRKLAFRTGRVIAICHDRKNTIEVLSGMMPELERDGIRFVRASALAD